MWSFGQRTPKGGPLGPGPAAYSPGAWPQNLHGSWGPPPRHRPPSAPPPLRLESPDRRKPKPRSALPGATFKGKYLAARPTDGPGPAYKPCCQGKNCCAACEGYHGPSFGIRHYQHPPYVTPAPNQYHVACPTLGAAAAGCSGEGGETYHKPLRTDHAYASGLRP